MGKGWEIAESELSDSALDYTKGRILGLSEDTASGCFCLLAVSVLLGGLAQWRSSTALILGSPAPHRYQPDHVSGQLLCPTQLGDCRR